MDIKMLLGVIAAGLNIVAFGPYIMDTIRGKTKPHTYSWFIWTLLTAIIFAGQLAGGAGPGAWTTGCTTVADFIIFMLALKRGTTDITLSDKVCLGSALVVLFLWAISRSALVSTTLVTIVDTLAFIPTIRKALKAPHEETFVTYPVNAIRCLLSISAITTYSMVTCLYPYAMLTIYIVMTAILMPERLRQAKPSRVRVLIDDEIAES